MKVLLLGAHGMLGRDLAASAPRDVTLIPRSREELDVTEPDAIEAALDAVRPDVVINSSGYTAVDRAEVERDDAFAVNATAVGGLARACAIRGTRLVHFSTDYVFDGTSSTPYLEEDAPSPLNVYGASKLAGERAVLSSGAAALVVRTQWLFGSAGRSFARTMSERAQRRQSTRVVADQRGRPTLTIHLARATWELLDRQALGLLHVAAAGEATWYDLAARIFAHHGVPELVTPCTTAEYPRPAPRPAYSLLDTSRAARLLGRTLPTWQQAVDEFLSSVPEHSASIES
jgi:dTDP-4-dehydrorhamnose reductase